MKRKKMFSSSIFVCSDLCNARASSIKELREALELQSKYEKESGR